MPIEAEPAAATGNRVPPRRRALLLINRHARSGRADLGAAEAVLRAAGIEMVGHGYPDSCPIPEAIRAAGPTVDCVIVGGGDGTMNAAAPALHDTGLTLGILPLGTANDLARTLGIPPDPVAAARIIANGHRIPVDLGEVNGHLFWNVASLGLSVALTRELSAPLKKRWGTLGYAIAAARILRRMRPFHADLVHDGIVERVRTVQIGVGNGRYYGGGMAVDDTAQVDDGLLHVYSLDVDHWWQLLALLPSFRSGRHKRWRDVHAFTTTQLEIRTRKPRHVNTDGEISASTPAHVRLLRHAVSVYAPVDARGAAAG